MKIKPFTSARQKTFIGRFGVTLMERPLEASALASQWAAGAGRPMRGLMQAPKRGCLLEDGRGSFERYSRLQLDILQTLDGLEPDSACFYRRYHKCIYLKWRTLWNGLTVALRRDAALKQSALHLDVATVLCLHAVNRRLRDMPPSAFPWDKALAKMNRDWPEGVDWGENDPNGFEGMSAGEGSFCTVLRTTAGLPKEMRDPRSNRCAFEDLPHDQARCRAVGSFRIQVLSIIAGLQSFTSAEPKHITPQPNCGKSAAAFGGDQNHQMSTLSFEASMSSPATACGDDRLEQADPAMRIRFTVIASKTSRTLAGVPGRRSSVIEWDGNSIVGVEDGKYTSALITPGIFGWRSKSLSHPAHALGRPVSPQ